MSLRRAPLLLALMVAGCANGGNTAGTPSSAPGNGADLVGRTFVSTAVTTDGKPVALLDGASITLTLRTANQLDARINCNSLQADVQVSSRLTVGSIATTDMGCPQPKAHEQDQWLAKFLESDPAWALTGAELKLSGDGTEVLMTEKAAIPDKTLVGTKWQVDSIEKDGTAASVPAGREAYLTIDADGKVQGNLGCNMFGSTAKVDGAKIVFTDVMSTKMACQDDVMAVENTMSAVLESGPTYLIKGDTLLLTSPSGQAVRLRAAG